MGTIFYRLIEVVSPSHEGVDRNLTGKQWDERNKGRPLTRAWIETMRHRGGKGVGDQRRVEFSPTTIIIARFFSADLDHGKHGYKPADQETDEIVEKGKDVDDGRCKSGHGAEYGTEVSKKSGKLPSECRPERTWRTRPDPYESVWPEGEGILKRSPAVEATTVFDHLNRVHEGKFEEGQLRTLQRHIKQWRTRNGELKEVMFPQRHEPGHQAQSDFTFMNSLE